jgi:hypothetical protein
MGAHLSTVSLGQNYFYVRVLFQDFRVEGDAWVVHRAPVPCFSVYSARAHYWTPCVVWVERDLGTQEHVYDAAMRMLGMKSDCWNHSENKETKVEKRIKFC